MLMKIMEDIECHIKQKLLLADFFFKFEKQVFFFKKIWKSETWENKSEHEY